MRIILVHNRLSKWEAEILDALNNKFNNLIDMVNVYELKDIDIKAYSCLILAEITRKTKRDFELLTEKIREDFSIEGKPILYIDKPNKFIEDWRNTVLKIETASNISIKQINSNLSLEDIQKAIFCN